ncbi:uncharacterized protein RHO25_010575 [Cercospora beticola]|uniref:Suppressor of anucleate metulae protein B n=1 Tax=Cercospora beticola TaxID=122368 RepID=A0ABZ0P297_CERBT|nr:hypothetical protein RHO25_010575 [Cercospora beticola]
MSTTSGYTKCAACGKNPPRPTLICGDCREGLDLDGRQDRTPYCTTQCRQLDLTNHQKQCGRANRRKQIYRAGRLLQLTFYHFRDLSFDLKIDRVEEHDRRMVLYDGISRTIEEVDLTIDTSICALKRVAFDGKAIADISAHIVLSVETVDGDAFVFDISGAQFGQPCPVLPLQYFMDLYRKPEIKFVSKFGSAHSRNIPMMECILEDPEKDVGALALQAHMARALNECVEPWEEKREMSFNELLNSPRPRFDKLAKDFFSVAYDSIVKGAKILEHFTEVVDVGQLIQMLDPVPLIPRPSTVLVTNNVEGSTMYQLWIAQHRARIQTQRGPVWWANHEPELKNGGGIIVHLHEGSEPDEEAMIEAASAFLEEYCGHSG